MEGFKQHPEVRPVAAPTAAQLTLANVLAEQAHGQALLDSHQIDVLELVIASLDGEKDPRALLLGLHCVRTAVALYVRQPDTSLHSQRLEVSVGESSRQRSLEMLWHLQLTSGGACQKNSHAHQ